MQPHLYRTIWISDVHLGTATCRADALLDFLRHHDAERWFLVGDVFDGWAMRRAWFWGQAHNDVVQKLLRKARKGAEVTYIPGNHDDFVRDSAGLRFGGITVRQRAVHTTADGRQLLVLHGDEFDGVVRHAQWLSKLGAGGYRLVLHLDRHLDTLRDTLGLPYWSLSAYLKSKAQKATQLIGDFSRAVAAEARMCDVDGVVCGHIHHAEMREIDGIAYFNCGDWVESCTALVEHLDGRMEILSWTEVRPLSDAAYAGDGLPTEPALPLAHLRAMLASPA